MSVIILEGSDAVFKTTIANKLSKRLGYPIIKGSSFELSQCSNEELFEHFKKQAGLDNVIIDRSIWSNRVYATLYEDYAILTSEQRMEIEDMLRRKSIVYYLFADDEIVKERIRQRGDDYVNEDMVSKINDEYGEVMMDSTVTVAAYDTGEWSSDEIVEDIIITDYK